MQRTVEKSQFDKISGCLYDDTFAELHTNEFLAIT